MNVSQLQSVAAEIAELHAEILGAARMSLEKAIRIGELLYWQKARLQHGEWLPWLTNNVAFSDQTARNYMLCFDRRDELESKFKSLLNLWDAYKFLTAKSTAVEKTRELFTAIDSAEVDPSIVAGDFRDADIKDDSLSLIFTDPPYDKKAEELLFDLADFAARKLVSGGSIIFYLGHLQLPAAFDAFIGKLRHWWTCAYTHSGPMALMREYGIRVAWKPMLWFVKERRGDVSQIVVDKITGEQAKTHHQWQQGETAALYWIEQLCPENGVVFDPFLGSGTTAVAAEKLKRKWLACEIDPGAAALATKRIHDARI